MTELNLNPFLQPVNAPVSTNNFTSGYEFDYNNERGAVNAAHIKNFSFNAGQGGTLNLGGTGNVSGVLSIDDAGGTEIIRGDYTGLTVKNNGGTTFIDGSGLISLANFASDNIKNSPSQSFGTSGSYADVTNGSISVVLQRTSKVLILSGCDVYHSFAGDAFSWGEIGISIAGSSPVKSMIRAGESKAGDVLDGHMQTIFAHTINSIPAGTTVVKLQARQTNVSGAGTPTFVVFTADMSYVVLGN